MSLILEALKKLEREKQAPDRGFLVMAHVPWASVSAGRGTRWLWLAAGTFAVALGGLGLYRLVTDRSRTPPIPLAPATTPASQAPVPQAMAPAGRVESPGDPAGRASSSAPPQRPTAPPESADPGQAPPAAAPAASGPLSSGAPADALELRLNAISQQDGRPVAILNDRLVREGDSFGGILIVRIGEAEVEVEVDGQRRVVRF